MYAEADALERGSTFELGLKSKELSPQIARSKNVKEQEPLKLSVRGSTLWSMGGLLHLCPALNQECINHKPVLTLLKEW